MGIRLTFHFFFRLSTSKHGDRGSEPTAASGGRKEASEWQRPITDDGALPPRKRSGTATGLIFQQPTGKGTRTPDLLIRKQIKERSGLKKCCL